MGAPKLIEYLGSNGNTYNVPLKDQAAFEAKMKGKKIGYDVIGGYDDDGGVYYTLEPGKGWVPFDENAPDPELEGIEDEAMALPNGTASVPVAESFPDAGMSSDVGISTLDVGVPDGGMSQQPIEGAAAPVPVTDSAPKGESMLDKARRGQAELARSAQTVGRGINAPLKQETMNDLESFARGAGDQFGMGFSDEAAGLGGAAYELFEGQGNYGDAFNAERDRYKAEDEAAREEDPGLFLTGSMLASVPMSIAMRRAIPGGLNNARQAEQAAARSASASPLVSHTVASLKDALFNPGNVLQSALSGAGHAEGRPFSTEWAQDALSNAEAEHLAGAVVSPAIEGAVSATARPIGRRVMRAMRSEINNPKDAARIVTAMNAGTRAETFEKPMPGPNPTTSAAGYRPGRRMRADLDRAREGAPTQTPNTAEQMRRRSANDITDALKRQRDHAVDRAATRNKEAFAKPENQHVIDADHIQDTYKPETYRYLVGEGYMHPAPGPRSPTPSGAERYLTAKQLDQAIDTASDQAEEYTNSGAVKQAAAAERVVTDLRLIRENNYPELHEIAKETEQNLSRLQENLVSMGIPRNRKPITNEDAELVYNRLAQYKDNAMTQAGVERMGPWGADAQLAEQAVGQNARSELVAEQQALGPMSKNPLGVIRTILSAVKPGMRAAGMENLGLNTQAALRGPTREYLQYLLGPYAPGPTSEELPK